MTDELKRRRQKWYAKGKRPEEVTYGMLEEGFRSLSGIPDNFYSAEDPKDRAALWNKKTAAETPGEGWYLTGSGDCADWEKKD